MILGRGSVAHSILLISILFLAFKAYAQNPTAGEPTIGLQVQQVDVDPFPLARQPVAYVGHGALFSPTGQEISQSPGTLNEIQQYYIRQLTALLTTAEREEYEQFGAPLIAAWNRAQAVLIEDRPNDYGFGLDRQQLVINSLFFEKLIDLYNPADVGRLASINGLIKRIAMDPLTFLDEEDLADATSELKPFFDIIDPYKDGVTQDFGPLLLSTMLGGADYIDECDNAGVPTPPKWGTSAWKPAGTLATKDEFISKEVEALPYIYQSASPVGACIALPRVRPGTRQAGLLGIICVGKESGNACFWDNQRFVTGQTQTLPNGTVVPRTVSDTINNIDAEIDISDFLGGADIAGGIGGPGECSVCHAGENPFVLHPGTALGHWFGATGTGAPGIDVNNTTTQTMPKKFYDPIVHPGWYQNEKASTLVDQAEASTDLPSGWRCSSCHSAKGNGAIGVYAGGRFPRLTGRTAAYCRLVLKRAISKETRLDGEAHENSMPLVGYKNGGVDLSAHDWDPDPNQNNEPGDRTAVYNKLVDLIDAYCSDDPRRTDKGKSVGDPHIRTINDIDYDFHAPGDYVYLKGSDGFEVQVRQAAIPTQFFPGRNAHTQVASCVSINTGVAAQVGANRVSYQSSLTDAADPGGMQLRVDGVQRSLPSSGLILSSGGRIRPTGVGGIEILFPNGDRMTAVPHFWNSHQKWFLNVGVEETEATRGIGGYIPSGAWLPALPDGSTVGARPSSASARYNVLNRQLADAWRVNSGNSLFDYAQNEGPDKFRWPAGWPKQGPQCTAPNMTATPPAEEAAARAACSAIEDARDRRNCEFDYILTGADVFVKGYEIDQALKRKGVNVELSLVRGRNRPFDERIYVAYVKPRFGGLTRQPEGAVQISVDGEVDPALDQDVDRGGFVYIRGSDLPGPDAIVSAAFTPAAGSDYLPGVSAPYLPSVDDPDRDAGPGADGAGPGIDKPSSADRFLKELLKQYPWLIYVLIGLLILFFILWVLCALTKRR